jgi:hypothetical protein
MTDKRSLVIARAKVRSKEELSEVQKRRWERQALSLLVWLSEEAGSASFSFEDIADSRLELTDRKSIDAMSRSTLQGSFNRLIENGMIEECSDGEYEISLEGHMYIDAL